MIQKLLVQRAPLTNGGTFVAETGRIQFGDAVNSGCRIFIFIMSVTATTERRARVQRGMIVGAVIAGVILLTFLCLRSSPHVRDFAWIPGWFARWVDTNGVWRNSWAFGVLAALAGGAVSRGKRIYVYLGVALFAAGLETLQLMIPSRVFDWRDIGASWLGIGVWWAAGYVKNAIERRLTAAP